MNNKILIKILGKLPQGVSSKISRQYVKQMIKKYANLKIEGAENLKEVNGSTIFICNHLSNSDGLILNEVLKENDPTFIAGVKLSDNAFTKNGISYVKTISIKPNSADKEAISKIVQKLKAGENIMMFPEGTRSRTGAMIEAKKGLLLIARLAKATIVPIGITGSEIFMPINDSDMGGETFNPSNVVVKIGKPMQVPAKEKEEDKNAYNDRAMFEIMKGIADLLPENYRGVYK